MSQEIHFIIRHHDSAYSTTCVMLTLLFNMLYLTFYKASWQLPVMITWCSEWLPWHTDGWSVPSWAGVPLFDSSGPLVEPLRLATSILIVARPGTSSLFCALLWMFWHSLTKLSEQGCSFSTLKVYLVAISAVTGCHIGRDRVSPGAHPLVMRFLDTCRLKPSTRSPGPSSDPPTVANIYFMHPGHWVMFC